MSLIPDITEVPETMVTLLVDAGWIRIEREWFRPADGERDETDVRHRMTPRSALCNCPEWKFPSSQWIPTRSIPATGGRGNKWIWQVANDWGDEHAIEITITAKGRKMRLNSELSNTR